MKKIIQDMKLEHRRIYEENRKWKKLKWRTQEVKELKNTAIESSGRHITSSLRQGRENGSPSQ